MFVLGQWGSTPAPTATLSALWSTPPTDFSIYNSNNSSSSPRKQTPHRHCTAPANDPPTPLRLKTLQHRRLVPELSLYSCCRQGEREEYQEPSPQRRRRRNHSKNNNEMSFGAQVVNALRRHVTKQSKSVSEIIKNWNSEDDFNKDDLGWHRLVQAAY